MKKITSSASQNLEILSQQSTLTKNFFTHLLPSAVSYTVESTLKDYDRIAGQIRRAKKSGDNGENVADESGGDESVRKKALVLPWRQVETEGICQSSVTFEGGGRNIWDNKK